MSPAPYSGDTVSDAFCGHRLNGYNRSMLKNPPSRQNPARASGRRHGPDPEPGGLPASTQDATPGSLLLYCRAGSENDCAAEIMALSQAQGVSGFCRTRADSGHVVFEAPGQAGQQGMAALIAGLHWLDLIFIRQWLVLLHTLTGLPPDDRVTPLVQALLEGPGGQADGYADLWLEHPDTDAGKEMATFCKRFRGALTGGLARAGIDTGKSNAGWRLHAFFIDSSQAMLAMAPVARSTPHSQGIIRLKFPREAPSRSTLKLEEALQLLLSADDHRRLLRPGNTAVDLGAAPGGWTWQLVRRNLRVTAVDNGPMQAALMDSGLVEHRREDGFRYRPPRPVDLLVCDMVERPNRIAALMGQWLRRGDCRGAVFNLKLPMKQRHRAVMECLDALPPGNPRGEPFTIRCRQLYHDRQEVTVAVMPGSRE